MPCLASRGDGEGRWAGAKPARRSASTRMVGTTPGGRTSAGPVGVVRAYLGMQLTLLSPRGPLDLLSVVIVIDTGQQACYTLVQGSGGWTGLPAAALLNCPVLFVLTGTGQYVRATNCIY